MQNSYYQSNQRFGSGNNKNNYLENTSNDRKNPTRIASTSIDIVHDDNNDFSYLDHLFNPNLIKSNEDFNLNGIKYRIIKKSNISNVGEILKVTHNDKTFSILIHQHYNYCFYTESDLNNKKDSCSICLTGISHTPENLKIIHPIMNLPEFLFKIDKIDLEEVNKFKIYFIIINYILKYLISNQHKYEPNYYKLDESYFILIEDSSKNWKFNLLYFEPESNILSNFKVLDNIKSIIKKIMDNISNSQHKKFFDYIIDICDKPNA